MDDALDDLGPPDVGDLVRAAGGAVWRWGGSSLEVLLVHRPRYDDWTLPKGKLKPGETDEEAALREVAEEAGVECDLGAELMTTSYVDRRGRPKVVRYWAMEVVGPTHPPFHPNDEVDQLAWLPIHKAHDRLTYPADREVLDTLVDAAGV